MKKFSNMSDDEMSTFVNDSLVIVDRGDITEAKKLCDTFKDMGGVNGIHVAPAGVTAKLTTRQTLEWYVGQFISICENDGWFAMNSFLNMRDQFSPYKGVYNLYSLKDS